MTAVRVELTEGARAAPPSWCASRRPTRSPAAEMLSLLRAPEGALP